MRTYICRLQIVNHRFYLYFNYDCKIRVCKNSGLRFVNPVVITPGARPISLTHKLTYCVTC